MSATDGNPGCLAALLRLFGSDARSEESSAEEAFPYRVRDDFLSPAEALFYGVLSSVVRSRAVVCPKVGLRDLFFVTRPHENRSAANRITQKHVDFLLCDPDTMKPILGVELDDASHSRLDRKMRDDFVDGVFEAARLALLRVPAQRGYHPQELAALIEPFLDTERVHVTDNPNAGTKNPPSCPKCGIPMVMRRAARGERRGEQFFGCSNYPKCRETLPLTQ